MKIKYLIIYFIFINACKREIKTDRTLRTINLINEIGSINIELTNDFDTLHSWKRSSDYQCGDEKYYRFQSSNYPILEEKYFASELPDSSYGMTITHQFYQECADYNNNFDPKLYIEQVKEKQAQNVGFQNVRFKILKEEKIDDFQFVIYATLDTNYKNIIEQKLCALTEFNKQYIHFEFLKTSTHLTDTTFIWESYEMLKTIKIKNDIQLESKTK